MFLPTTDENTQAFEKAADLCGILAGYWIALTLVRWLSSHTLFVYPARWQREYSVLLFATLLLWLAASAHGGVYHSHRAERIGFSLWQFGKTLALWGLLTIGSVFLLNLPNISRQFVFYVLTCSASLVLARQFVTIVALRRLHRFGYNWRTVLIIGSRTGCDRFMALLGNAYPMGYHIVALPLDGEPDETERVLEASEEIDEAFILGDARQGETYALDLLKRGKRVHVVPELLDVRLFHQSLSDVAGIPVVSLLAGRLNKAQLVAKRLADLAGACLLVVLSSPVLALTALIIKCSSKGPVFFRQTRIGQKGKFIKIYKFRSMNADAEEVLKKDSKLREQYIANNFKLPEGKDPRITKIGAFLRATSLDELPQLFNVINGDMSLVGPRPVVPAEVGKYGDCVQLLLSAKPGMTGHWQINGRSEIEQYARRVELDMEYIRDQSLGKDLEILLRTVPAVLLRKGAH
jgi:exopolysaccharide biosynthesis polyprenyl glycosylphosphotransferase